MLKRQGPDRPTLDHVEAQAVVGAVLGVTLILDQKQASGAIVPRLNPDVVVLPRLNYDSELVLGQTLVNYQLLL